MLIRPCDWRLYATTAGKVALKIAVGEERQEVIESAQTKMGNLTWENA